MEGPFPKPEDACAVLHPRLKDCPECQCWVTPGSRHETALGEAAVLELRTETAGANYVSGYALALHQKQGWYASSRFPSVLRLKTSGDASELVVIGRPKIEAGKRPGGGPAVALSLQTTDCRMPKGHEKSPPPCPIPYEATRARALACFRRTEGGPACTEVDTAFDAPDVDAAHCAN